MTTRRVAVVGGGIIGVATARELLRGGTADEVVLFEKEASVAAHQTGHNSGVVHAGLYYEPGSRKATLCRRGVTLIESYVAERGIPFDRCGKVVVAQDEAEVERLQAIRRRAEANGVPDVRLIGPEELRRIEPHAVGLRALHSPATGIVDYIALTRALADDVAAAGGELRLRTEVRELREGDATVTVVTDTAVETFDLVVSCAGLQSDRLARRSGEARQPVIIPFYGDYFLLDGQARDLVRGLIYPVPDPRYPFLGVHLTRRVDGEVMLGPNAFLSLGREAYSRGLVDLPDLAETLGTAAFWRFASRNVPAAVRESRTAFSAKRFVEEARRYVPAVEHSDIRRGPRGVRAQAVNPDGTVVDDFVFGDGRRLLQVRNAPSPGATSSMAIAEFLVSELRSRVDGLVAR